MKYKHAVRSIGKQPVQTGPTSTPYLPPDFPTKAISGSSAHLNKVLNLALLRHCKTSYEQNRAASIPV